MDKNKRPSFDLGARDRTLRSIYSPEVCGYLAGFNPQVMQNYILGMLVVGTFDQDTYGYNDNLGIPQSLVTKEQEYSFIYGGQWFGRVIEELGGGLLIDVVSNDTLDQVANAVTRMAFWQGGHFADCFDTRQHRYRQAQNTLFIVDYFTKGFGSLLVQGSSSKWKWNGPSAALLLPFSEAYGFSSQEVTLLEMLFQYDSIKNIIASSRFLTNIDSLTTLARSIRIKFESHGQVTADGESLKYKRECLLQWLTEQDGITEQEVDTYKALLNANGAIAYAAGSLEGGVTEVIRFLRARGYYR